MEKHKGGRKSHNHKKHFAPKHNGPGDTRRQPCPLCKGKWTWQVLIEEHSVWSGSKFYWQCKNADHKYLAQ